MEKIKQKIKYLKEELADRKNEEGWLIEGLRKELIRLETKYDRQTSKTNIR